MRHEILAAEVTTREVVKAAAGFDRPLLLTPGEDLRGCVLRYTGQSILLAVTFTSVVAVLLIFYFIIREALPFLVSHGLTSLLESSQWYPEAEPAEFGGLALVVGSLYVTVMAMLMAVPFGLLMAVFLSDIVPFSVRQIIKPVIELLAAIPSVAYGFFAVMVLAPWMQEKLGLPTGVNALNASFVLAVMAIPTIVSVSEDALTASGREMREGAYALGATRFEMLFGVVIPSAKGGIAAAVILGMMRAIGETMVVWMASGNAAQVPSPWWDVTQSIRTMTATIAGDMGETPKGSDHYHALFAVGFMLLIFTFILNLISECLLSRTRRITGGGAA
jgi:phosphate transport system permease protein